MRRIAGVAAAAAIFVACSPQAPAQNAPAQSAPDQNVPTQIAEPQGTPQIGLRRVELTIHSANGVHEFEVAVAASPREQELGLMFRRSLGPSDGMIFPFDPPREVAFWMKNTLIPLDMVFIRADGSIVRVATAKPLDETPVPSTSPIVAVLEIAGGRAAELGIDAGDKVNWPH